MDPILASLLFFAGTYAPRGYLACDGQLLSIKENNALFALLGTMYGGDGIQTFGLPKVPPMQLESGGSLLVCIATEGVYPARS